MKGNFAVSGLRLFWILFKRDFKLRYAGAGLGSLWNIFHPVLLFLVYALVFGYFLKFKAKLLGHQVDFLPFLFTGFWPWIAFSDGLMRCAYIVFEYATIIKRVRFSLAVLVPLAVAGALTPLLIGFFLLTVFLALKGELFLSPARLPLILLPLILQILLTVGLGYLIATLVVYVRDVQQLLPSLINLWFFLTPVFYSLELVPPWLRRILAFNPWQVILSWYRQLFLSPEIRWGLGEAWVFALGLVLFFLGYEAFRRGSRYFSDVL